MSAFLVEKAILDNEVYCSHSVPPSDLFAFRIIAATIGNWHFIDPASRFADLCRELRFKSKAILSERDLFQKLGTKNLVTGFHVGQIKIGEHIGQGGQDIVAH